jgi:hypothetical protein
MVLTSVHVVEALLCPGSTSLILGDQVTAAVSILCLLANILTKAKAQGGEQVVATSNVAVLQLLIE